MFETLPNPSLDTLLMIGRAVLLIGAFWVFALAFIRWRRADEAQAQRLQAQLERAFGEMRSLHETVTVMSARIESLTERANTEVRLPPVAVAGAQRGYDLAQRLVRNGAAIDELVTTCGITRHEAELLTRLHGGAARESAGAARPTRAPAPIMDRHPPAASMTTPAPQPAGRKRGSLLSVVS